MIGYMDAPVAWGLTRGMARLSGVNLTRAVLDGWLKRSELDQIVARCEACSCTGRCTAWLAQSAEARGMPGFCPNKAAIEALVAN